jgi:hypothetical protein
MIIKIIKMIKIIITKIRKKMSSISPRTLILRNKARSKRH